MPQTPFTVRIRCGAALPAETLASACATRLQRRGEEVALAPRHARITIEIDLRGDAELIVVEIASESATDTLCFAHADPTMIEQILLLAEDRSLLDRVGDTDAERMLTKRLFDLGYL
jgi:hypothetical protein